VIEAKQQFQEQMTEAYYHPARKAKSYPDIFALFLTLSAKSTIMMIAIESYEAMSDDNMNLAEGDEVLMTSEQADEDAYMVAMKGEEIGRVPCKICS